MIIGLNLNPIAVVVVVVIVVFCSYSGEAQSAIQPATPLTFGSYPTSVWDVSSVCVIIGSLIATLLLVFILLILLRRITTSHSNYVTESNNNKCESFNGIHPQLLQTFPILCFSSITNLKEEPLRLQCAVCLADFNHVDTLRLLPQCNHVFHPPCIDAWLSSHVTCPVCRANLNHHHHSLNFATILGDTETNDHSTSGGCGSEEDERNSEEEDKGEQENASKLKLMRSNSTGHSVVVECVEVEDVKNSIMQRSASCNSVRLVLALD